MYLIKLKVRTHPYLAASSIGNQKVGENEKMEFTKNTHTQKKHTKLRQLLSILVNCVQYVLVQQQYLMFSRYTLINRIQSTHKHLQTQYYCKYAVTNVFDR